jgi:CPA2 family monovalent cation:H+ antiporter-2
MATAAGWLARRAGLPAIVGYLAIGLLVSPFTPGYAVNREQLHTFADIGVVLLLFEVGVEIDPLRLGREHGRLLWSVPLQVLLTVGAGAGAGHAMGLGLQGALLLGLSVALSSSVVVVNITRSTRRTTNRVTEDTLLGWSVMQDIVGVAGSMALLTTLQTSSRPVLVAVAGPLVFLVIAAAGGALLLPRLLRRLRSHPDLFLLLSVASGLVFAGVGARVFDVPLALAAFVAGLAVGESPDADQARRALLPLRDLFAVLFFVAIGTLIDPRAVPGALVWIAVVVGLLVVGKVAVIALLARRLRRVGVRPRQLAIGLGQVGEFSFVLASIGVARGVISMELYTALLVVVVLSIAASAVVVRRGGPRPPVPPTGTPALA